MVFSHKSFPKTYPKSGNFGDQIMHLGFFSCFSNIRWWFQIVVHLCFTYTCMFAIPFTVQHFAYESQHQTRYTVRSTWIKWVQMFFCSPRSLRKWLPNLTCAIFFSDGSEKQSPTRKKTKPTFRGNSNKMTPPGSLKRSWSQKWGENMGKMSSLPGWFPS